MGGGDLAGKHAFLCYARQDATAVDRLHAALEAAGIGVWRDTAQLWPGEDWRAKIRQAITSNALAFVACFSRSGLARERSYQNEELAVAVDEFRRRRPGVPWLTPVRLDDCQIPDLPLGGGRTLEQLQHADLFGERREEETARLAAALARLLRPPGMVSVATVPGERPVGVPDGSGVPAAAGPAGRRADQVGPRRRVVAECDPIGLGVHRAIRVTGQPAGAQQLGELPVFVPRDHDRLLRAEIGRPTTGSKLIVLIGGSSTGKTRSAVEAIRHCVPDWALIHVMTASDLVRSISDGLVGPRTVLWLNETQVYLEGSQEAEAVTAIAGVLTEAGPVLAVGTLWPDYWLAYVKPPEFGAPDPYRHARQLLDTAVKIDVPDRFSEPDLRRARRLAAQDRRLAVALATHHDQGITQVLAGGPALIDRWKNAPDPYGKAVITAAIDARRLGHHGILSAGLLQDAATAYLSGPQLASAAYGWFEHALLYARETVKGAIAPLTATSRTLGSVDGYLLADYLDQHGRSDRCATHVPDLLWQALAAHARLPADLNRLGSAAADRGRYGYACDLWAAACDRGDLAMAMPLWVLLDHAGYHRRARDILTKTASAGDPEGIALLGELIRRGDQRLDLEHALRQAATGGFRAAHELAHLLHKNARPGEAEQVLTEAIAAGDPDGRRLLAIMLARSGRNLEAEQLLARAARNGDIAALRSLTNTLQATGRLEDAAQLLGQAVSAQVPGSARELARLLQKMNRTSAAHRKFLTGLSYRALQLAAWAAVRLRLTGV